MIPLELVFIPLITIACASPLLTFLHLWQLKEWRIDRLIEHLKSEHLARQLLGVLRPLILVCWGLAWIACTIAGVSMHEKYWFLVYALIIAGVGLAQILLQRQPRPVWTSKALSIFVLAIIADFAVTTAVTFLTTLNASGQASHPLIWIAVALPLLQPMVAMDTGVVLMPIDRFLKRRVMHRAMRIRTDHPNLTVIGITGSVGKTTTKELLKHLLADRGAIATPLHVNTEMGVAQWLTTTLNNEPVDSKKILIVEMGAYRIGEIALLSSIAQPTIGVLTYVGRQHVALFGSAEKIAQAKGELLAGLPESGQAFVNGDSPLLQDLLKRATSPVTTVGSDHGSDTSALDIEETGQGIRFRAFDRVFDVPLAGTHTVVNILLAIAAAKHLGVPLDEIARKLKTFTAFEHTFARREERGVVILDNTYNLSPESMRAAIEWAARQPHKEKILLADGIIELGDDEERIHLELAEEAAKVFTTAYIISQRFLPYFEPAFGKRVMPASQADTVPKGALLVCLGRMSESRIQSLLPTD